MLTSPLSIITYKHCYTPIVKQEHPDMLLTYAVIHSVLAHCKHGLTDTH